MQSYTKQILRGLRYLHEHGYAHRDIKGGNVLLAEDGAVKLADFGTTKTIMTPATSARGALTAGPSPREQGTPHWMAPEVIAGNARGKGWQAADIWSVACTVVEMLTARPPWPEAKTHIAAMCAIVTSKSLPVVPPGTSADCLVRALLPARVPARVLTTCACGRRTFWQCA